jgi:hypothetical protein
VTFFVQPEFQAFFNQKTFIATENWENIKKNYKKSSDTNTETAGTLL